MTRACVKTKPPRQGGALSVERRIELLKSTASNRRGGISAITRALRDRSPRVRATAVDLVARQKRFEFSNEIHELLSDRSYLVRSEATEALGVLDEGSGNHHEDLASRLKDVKAGVRIAAIESIVQIEDAHSIPEMATCLKDRNPLVRAYAAIGLAQSGCRDFDDQILVALLDESDDTATAGFIVALVILGDKTRLKSLLGLLSSKQYQVRCFVANWIPRLKLKSEHLEWARAGLKQAYKHPLGRADESTVATVLKELSGRVAHR